jgi:hypothetical protein
MRTLAEALASDSRTRSDHLPHLLPPLPSAAETTVVSN